LSSSDDPGDGSLIRTVEAVLLSRGWKGFPQQAPFLIKKKKLRLPGILQGAISRTQSSGLGGGEARHLHLMVPHLSQCSQKKVGRGRWVQALSILQPGGKNSRLNTARGASPQPDREKASHEDKKPRIAIRCEDQGKPILFSKTSRESQRIKGDGKI